MLNARLLTCAGFVCRGGHVCDVGTDHALLPVYLLEQGIAADVIAADIGEGPLQAAQRTITQHGQDGKIRTILSDGLQKILPEGLTDIIIAGMGGETIIHILKDCPFSLKGISLILQPMTKAYLLREWLYGNGFVIQEEVCVRDDRHLYAVMHVRYTGDIAVPDAVMCYLGRMDMAQPDCRAYAERQYVQLCRKRDGLLASGQDPAPFAQDAETIRNYMEDHNELHRTKYL